MPVVYRYVPGLYKPLYPRSRQTNWVQRQVNVQANLLLAIRKPKCCFGFRIQKRYPFTGSKEGKRIDGLTGKAKFALDFGLIGIISVTKKFCPGPFPPAFHEYSEKEISL